MGDFLWEHVALTNLIGTMIEGAYSCGHPIGISAIRLVPMLVKVVPFVTKLANKTTLV